MNHWINQIDNTTEAFTKHFGSLTYEQLNWKQNAKSWSIAQNIDHLIKINASYFPALMSLRNDDYPLPFIARFNFIVSFLGKTVLKAVNPDRKKKMKTFSIWEPESSDISLNILEAFTQHQEELKTEIKASKSLLEKRVIISSPANQNIVYTLEMAFDLIVNHELRHLEQAKEVLALIEKENTVKL